MVVNKEWKNLYRHWYLYAKGHYEESDNKVEDLKIIQSHYSGVDAQYLSLSDVICMMLEIANEHISTKFHGDHEHSFKGFVHRVIDKPLLN